MAILRTRGTNPGWGVWIWWMLASIAGGVGYVAAMVPFMRVVTFIAGGGGEQEAPVPDWFGVLIGVISTGAIGAMVGLGQWLVLRRLVPGTGWWVPATSLGYATLLGVRFLDLSEGIGWLAGLMVFLIPGTALGILQWLVLRGRIEHAKWWIAISIAGWALAFALTGLAAVSGMYVEPFDMLAALLVPVAVTGAGLVRLLRNTPPVLPPVARQPGAQPS